MNQNNEPADQLVRRKRDGRKSGDGKGSGKNKAKLVNLYNTKLT